MVLRRRRWTRRAAALATVAAAFAIGVATGQRHEGAEPSPRGEPPERGRAAAPVTQPGDLERRALASASVADQAILLKAAGDRYLNDHGDVESALRCYRGVLRLAAAEHRTEFDPADTWLFAALKRGVR
jgi:hypothetical protein